VSEKGPALSAGLFFVYHEPDFHEFKELAHHLAGNSREGGYEEEIYEA